MKGLRRYSLTRTEQLALRGLEDRRAQLERDAGALAEEVRERVGEKPGVLFSIQGNVFVVIAEGKDEEEAGG